MVIQNVTQLSDDEPPPPANPSSGVKQPDAEAADTQEEKIETGEKTPTRMTAKAKASPTATAKSKAKAKAAAKENVYCSSSMFTS